MSETSLPGRNIYEHAITTHRSAEKLARKHGFGFVGNLAESLPVGARVLDVGAGASPLGKEVAALRPDILWTNYDYSYFDSDILNEVSNDAPYNVQHVAGDATQLTDVYEPESFDAIFSYWLLPHLSLESPDPALVAAKAIFALTRQDGFMSVGPRASKLTVSLWSGPAIRVDKNKSWDADMYAKRIVQETTLIPSARFLQKTANEVATPFFGTSRYLKHDGRMPQLYHPESREYVTLLSPKSAQTIGRLTVALASHAVKQLRP